MIWNENDNDRQQNLIIIGFFFLPPILFGITSYIKNKNKTIISYFIQII